MSEEREVLLLLKHEMKLTDWNGGETIIPLPNDLADSGLQGERAREEFHKNLYKANPTYIKNLEVDGTTLSIQGNISQAGLYGDLDRTKAYMNIPLFSLPTKAVKDKTRVRIERCDYSKSNPQRWKDILERLQTATPTNPTVINAPNYYNLWQDYGEEGWTWCKNLVPTASSSGYLSWHLVPYPSDGQARIKMFQANRAVWDALPLSHPAYKGLRTLVDELDEFDETAQITIRFNAGTWTANIKDYKDYIKHKIQVQPTLTEIAELESFGVNVVARCKAVGVVRKCEVDYHTPDYFA